MAIGRGGGVAIAGVGGGGRQGTGSMTASYTMKMLSACCQKLEAPLSPPTRPFHWGSVSRKQGDTFTISGRS